MEELKILVEMVADLPDLAIAVILAFFAYKMFIVGSIYGVIKLGIKKLHDAIVYKKIEIKEIDKKFIYNMGGDKKFISDEAESAFNELCAEIASFNGSDYGYVHESDVKRAIKIIREKRSGKQ